MAAKKKSSRRRRAGEAAFAAGTGAALGYGAARYGGHLLNMMPHGFDSLAAGQGKGPTDNKRVIILVAGTLYAVTTRNKKVRRWAPMLGFMTGLAVKQHKMTYEGFGDINQVEQY